MGLYGTAVLSRADQYGKLEMLVKMTKEEQGRFFTEFRSLLMDE